MYYISSENDFSLSRKVKTLKEFPNKYTKEGELFGVRTRAKLEQWDGIPIYVIKDGKLVKTKTTALIW